MSSHAANTTDSNPFSTRFIRPGAIAYLFDAEHDSQSLLRSLDAKGGHGQIMGPHGSGKSTLVRALIAELQQCGIQVEYCQLSTTLRQLPASFGKRRSQETAWIVDGYEQLSWWTRRRLQWRCRRGGDRLLVTTHHDLGLPLLYTTSITPERSWTIVCQLLQGFPPVLNEQIIRDTLARHADNLREALLELYDLYELGRRCV